MSTPRKFNTTEKYCSRCDSWKPHVEFHRAKYNVSGLATLCKLCTTKRNAESHKKHYSRHRARVLDGNMKWRTENPEKYKSRPSAGSERRRIYRRQKYYGLSPEEYQKRWDRQHGLCAVEGCGRPIRDIDHDHETGKTRDLLCSFCNTGLGLFKDDPALLRSAAKYLEKHKVSL